MNTRIRRSAIAITAAVVLPLSLAACGSDDSGDDDQGTGEGAPDHTDDGDEGADTDPEDDMGDDAAQDGGDQAAEPFGPACGAVPEDGPGSFEGMAQDPVATAASNNEDLSTLVTAVDAAGLVDTLNTMEDITVFAPADDAFAEIPEEDLEALLEDQEALTDVLTHHVVDERLAPEDLADGSFETVQGSEVTAEGSGEQFTVDGEATVVCGDVQTANGTVYIIDQVLMP